MRDTKRNKWVVLLYFAFMSRSCFALSSSIFFPEMFLIRDFGTKKIPRNI